VIVRDEVMVGVSRRLVILILCFLVVVTTSFKHVWSVFIPYVESEFMITRSVSVLPFSLLNIANIVGFLSTYYIKEVLGLKKLLSITAILMASGLVLTAISPSVLMLVGSFAFIYGLGNSFGYVLAVSLGIRWFRGYRAGLATGIIVSAYSFGVLTLSPLTTYLIQYFSSWRTPLLIYSIATSIVMAVAISVLKEPSTRNVGIEIHKLGLIEVVRSREFASIAIILFLTTLFDGLITGNLVPLVEEIVNVDPMTASLVMSIYSAIAIISRIVIGVVSECLDPLKTLIIIYTIAIANAILFPLYRNLPLIILGISVSALLFSTNVTLSPLIASLIWGTKKLETTYGLLLTAIVCGILVGPLIGGLSRDLTGNYYPGIALTAITLILGTLILTYTTKTLQPRHSH